MAVTQVRDALMSVMPEVYHYKAPASKQKYIVWGETGQSTRFDADDGAECLVIAGECYFFTKEEYDKTLDAICMALTAGDVSWTMTGAGYDDELGYIVYQFRWEVPCGNGEIY